MSAVAWGAHTAVSAVAAGNRLGPRSAQVFIPLLAGVAAYALTALAVRSPEFGELWQEFRGRRE